MKDIIKIIVEKIKVKYLFGIVFISSFILLLLYYVFNLNLINNIKMLFVMMIVSTSYFVIFIFEWINKKYDVYRTKRFVLNALRYTLTKDELYVLVSKFYNHANDCFDIMATLPINDGTANSLIARGIIYRANDIGVGGIMFDFNLFPYVANYLNKNRVKKMILNKFKKQKYDPKVSNNYEL